MPEENRKTDVQILSRLSVVETKLESNREVLEITSGRIMNILEKHDDLLYGKYGNNGLKTIVAKLQGRWHILIWAVGALAIPVAVQAISNFLK